jgi:SAM-dependent methyltransferase
VGTGYAGFLRAAREIGFCEVVGIEYAEGLVTLARANIADLPAAQVVSQDFLTGDFSGLGVFDLITCNDVIEHVDDPQLAMQKMAALTNPEGCICFEVPNKDAIPFVKSDGHFLIFGITQLPKDEAAEYHAAQTGAEKSFYLHEMGEMYELDWYLERLQELGFSARLAETYSLGGLEKVPELLADLNQGYQEWQVNKAPLLDKAIAGRVVAAVEKYLETLDQDFAKAANDQAAQTKFQYKYLRSFWTIIAVKG